MKIKRVIELQKDQLERYKALKMSCATCIDDETIEAQIETIEHLERCADLEFCLLDALKENQKLKSILKKYIDLSTIDYSHVNGIKCYRLSCCSDVSKEEYEELKEMLSNE